VGSYDDPARIFLLAEKGGFFHRQITVDSLDTVVTNSRDPSFSEGMSAVPEQIMSPELPI
jgi:hypothetical protein